MHSGRVLPLELRMRTANRRGQAKRYGYVSPNVLPHPETAPLQMIPQALQTAARDARWPNREALQGMFQGNPMRQGTVC